MTLPSKTDLLWLVGLGWLLCDAYAATTPPGDCIRDNQGKPIAWLCGRSTARLAGSFIVLSVALPFLALPFVKTRGRLWTFGVFKSVVFVIAWIGGIHWDLMALGPTEVISLFARGWIFYTTVLGISSVAALFWYRRTSA